MVQARQLKEMSLSFGVRTSNNGPHMVLPGNNTWRVGFWGGADVNGTGVDTSHFITLLERSTGQI